MPDDLLMPIAARTVTPKHDGVDPPVDRCDRDAVPGGGSGGDDLASRLRLVVAGKIDHASEEIVRLVVEALSLGAMEGRAGASTAELERAVGKRLVLIGQRMVAFVFATACQAAMDDDQRKRGLTHEQVRLRTDKDGYITVSTTFGPITFPTFTYRDLSSPLGSVIRHPSHRLFPYHPACRSTPLCLEWETRLGAQHPFRKAQEQLRFFTRGASTIEDTSIARHMLALNRMVDSSWLYRTPEQVRQVLRDRATRDKTTGRPLLYLSSDAHALRRYVDDTWAAQWKMVNGIRVWCEDAETGEVVHLGGEFLWGDCREVGARIRALLEEGVLPNGDGAWSGVDAQVVFVSDGAEWLIDHIVSLLPHAEIILDPYHVIDWFSAFARLVFGVGSKDGRELNAAVQAALFGKRAKVANTAGGAGRKRRGHKKKRRQRRPHAHDRRWLRRGRPRTVTSEATAMALLDILAKMKIAAEHVDAREALVERLAKNTLRIDYAPLLARGMQIGSGAMESMHRSGSQQRLKLPGARWLEETSQAVLQFRMLELGGRWEEFWSRQDLTMRIVAAFGSPTVERSSAAAV